MRVGGTERRRMWRAETGSRRETQRERQGEENVGKRESVAQIAGS